MAMSSIKVIRKIRKPTVAIPLFIKAADIQKDVTDYEILVQAEKAVGYGRAKVAQKIDGMWRVHMSDNEARNKLLGSSLYIRGKVIRTYNEHPHILRDEEGNIVETTKLTISNIPWSLNERDIFDALDKLEVELMSDINPANCRSPNDQSLTKRFYNAKLYAYIKKPKKVLPQFIQIGNFRAYLNYKEQLAETECLNCLKKGHLAKDCPNPTVCLDCHEEGHKKGSLRCKKGPGKSGNNADDNVPAGMECLNCLKKGHQAIDCTNPTVCLDCLEVGHKKGSQMCKKRMSESKGIEYEDLTSDEGDMDYSSSSDDEKEEGEIKKIYHVETPSGEKVTVNENEEPSRDDQGIKDKDAQINNDEDVEEGEIKEKDPNIEEPTIQVPTTSDKEDHNGVDKNVEDIEVPIHINVTEKWFEKMSKENNMTVTSLQENIVSLEICNDLERDLSLSKVKEDSGDVAPKTDLNPKKVEKKKAKVRKKVQNLRKQNRQRAQL